MTVTYKTEAEVEAVVRGFESCQTDKSAFKHRDHLTVAVWYLQTGTMEQATERMRSALSAFLNYHRVDPGKYNETITVFWIEMVRQVLDDLAPGITLAEKCNQVIDSLDNSQLAEVYYSKEVLRSNKAREIFVAPDLKGWRKN